MIDERSVDPEEVGEGTAEHVTEVHETDRRVREPVALADADPGASDAVVFPGGHGTEWDITRHRHARAALRTAVESDRKKALVVCHAVGILAFTRDSDGGLLVSGREGSRTPGRRESSTTGTGCPTAADCRTGSRTR